MGAFLGALICSQKRSANRGKCRQACPGLAAFGSGRLGAGISAMAFRRWRFSDAAAARAGSASVRGCSLGCAAGPLRFAARVDFGALARLRPGSESRPANQRFFATALIAAKPVKPCDGGVFEAFYLLSKKECNAAGRGRCLAGGFAPLIGFGAGFQKGGGSPTIRACCLPSCLPCLRRLP